MKKFWNFKAQDEKIGELILYGDISSYTWWGDEVTPKQFKEDLDALGDISVLNIYINSGGGDVFAGQAIHSMLKRHKAYKTVYVDGLAASIASVIAMAGDKIIMPKNAMMMIHNAWTITVGNKEELRKMADDMEKVDASILATYVAKTGLPDDEITAMMDAETWLTADEAVEKGFADELEEAKVIAASIKGGALVYGEQHYEISKYSGLQKKLDEKEGQRYHPLDMTTKDSQPEPEPPNEGGFLMPGNGGGSQPVEDIALEKQRAQFKKLKEKLLEV